MSKVIEFPAKNSRKIVREENRRTQRAAMSLSVLSIIFAVVFANEAILKKTRNETIIAGGDNNFIGRNVASAGPIDPMRDIEWEHSLAERLAKKDLRNPASVLSETPTKMDALKFGYFEGKYSLSEKNGKLLGVEFQETVSGDGPKYISDRLDFIKENEDLIGLSFSQVERAPASEQDPFSEIYWLKNDKHKVQGSVKFTMDSEKRLLSLKVLPAL
jgi:hypothetical protein